MDRQDLDRLEKRFSGMLPDLISAGHRGRWVVVTDDGVLGVYDDFGSAYADARARVDGRAFIVQHVMPPDHAEKITRLRWA